MTKAEFSSIEHLCSIDFKDSYSNPLRYAHALYIDGEEITNLTIPKSVTSIGDYAFYGCSGLISILIGQSVRKIGSSAFYGCNNLRKAAYPWIISKPFTCNMLIAYIPTEVEIADGWIWGLNRKSIIYAPTSIKGEYIIPNTVERIEKNAFGGCDGITSITISNSVTSIDTGAFNGCNGLETVVFNTEYCNKLGDANSPVFPSSVKQLTIGESVRRIPDFAFYGCSGITTVTIPNSVTSIGERAFYGCSGLKSLTIGEAVQTIGSSAFSECGLETVVFNAKDCYSANNAESPVFPSSIKQLTIGESVTNVPDFAFYGCNGITSVIIPNSVTSIGERAFYGCSGITTVTIPNSVASIGERAFYGCNGLKSLTIGEAVQTIGSSAFSECGLETVVFNAKNCNGLGDANSPVFPSSVKQLTIGENVMKIPDFAFYGCNGITSVTIPNSVRNIGERAFYGCSGLKSLTIGEAVQTIGSSAFSDSGLETVVFNAKNCYSADNAESPVFPSSINQLTIGESVMKIPDFAFYGCSGITSLTIPNSVTSIGTRAFYGCSELKSLTIGKAVGFISDYAFSGCNKLETITYNAQNCSRCGTQSGSAFPPYVKDIQIADDVIRIPKYAFSGCSRLTSITIPGSVKNINEDAFIGCTGLQKAEFASINSLCEISFENYLSNPLSAAKHLYIDGGEITDIIIPDGTTSIGNYAFLNCTSLKSVIIPPSVTEIGADAFMGCTGLNKSAYPTRFANPFNYGVAIAYPYYNTEFTDDNWLFGNNRSSIYYVPTSFEGDYVVPETVTEIGDNAFYGCSDLTSIKIPASVKNIGADAFYGCNSLNKSEFESIEALCDIQFSNSSSNPMARTGQLYIDGSKITNLTIPQSVTSIGAYAFYNCNGLESVIIPPSVQRIGVQAFNSCSSLKKSIFPNNLSNPFNAGIAISYNPSGATIENNTVYGSNKDALLFVPLNTKGNYTIPASVSTIGAGAFSECKDITSINVSENITTVGEKAFYNCSRLSGITIPSKVTTIGNSAFANCTNVKTLTFNAKNCTSCGSSNAVAFPSEITDLTIGSNVTKIPDYAFSGLNKVASVTIPQSVTEIGTNAFYNCSGLSGITIPSKVTTIGSSAFANCTNVKTLTFNAENCTSCGSSNAVAFPSEITDLTIGPNITKIPDYAFSGLNKAASVTIPQSITEIGTNAFSGCSGLTKAEYKSVEQLCSINFKSAASNPLSYAHNLYFNGEKATEVVIPESVKSIGTYAFSGCNSVKQLTLRPDTSPRVEKSSFDNQMYQTTKLIAPESYYTNSTYQTVWNSFQNKYYYDPFEFTYTYKGQTITYIITNRASKTCKTSSNNQGKISGALELPENPIGDGISYTLSEIDSQSFYNSQGLTSVKIPKSVAEIQPNAFSGCETLKEVTFEDGDKICALGMDVFKGCSKLQSLYVGRTIDFSGNTGPFAELPVNQLSIGAGATTLTENLFSGLTKLQNITIPKTTDLIFPNVFADCTNIKTVTFEETSNPLYMINKFGESTGIEVLNLNRPLFVGSIEVGTKSYECEPKFSNCTSLTTINFGSNVTDIADNMFAGCTSLRSVTIPSNIREIKDKAFSGCIHLTSVNIEDSDAALTILSSTNSSGGGTTFENAPIETIYLGRNVEFKGTELSPFKNNPKLLNLTIGNKVTDINHYLFYGCSEITMLAVPSSVKTVGNFAFYDCNKSKSLTLSSSIESIGEYAFYNCNSLSRISIPNSVKTIGDYAFRNCNSAQKITLGKNLKTIGNFAFLDCFNATEITFGESVEEIGNNAFYNCAAVKKINIPNSAITIGNNAFSLCGEAEEITIGNKVKTIGARAFSDCMSVKEITLGSAVEEIGDFAFFNCEDVISIHVRANIPPHADENVFSDYSAKLYVPEGRRTDYAKSTQNCWPLFTIFEEKVEDGIEQVENDSVKVEVYNLSGIKVGDSLENLPRGVYIVRQGGKATKIAI